VPKVLTVEDGTMVRLAPGEAATIDDEPAGRLYKDGRIIGDIDAVGVLGRRRMSFAGHVAVSVILDDRGDVIQDPEIVAVGIPANDAAGQPLLDAVRNAILGALDSIPRRARRDVEVVRDAVLRAARASINEAWGKKPVCTVFVAVV
jgi:ribonuclease J